jgi:hypothetical protein
MGAMRGTRDIRLASDEQVQAMRDGLARLLENQRYVNPRALTELSLMDEEITAELGRRAVLAGEGK